MKKMFSILALLFGFCLFTNATPSRDAPPGIVDAGLQQAIDQSSSAVLVISAPDVAFVPAPVLSISFGYAYQMVPELQLCDAESRVWYPPDRIVLNSNLINVSQVLPVPPCWLLHKSPRDWLLSQSNPWLNRYSNSSPYSLSLPYT